MHIFLDDCGMRLVCNNTRENFKRLVSLRLLSALILKSFSYRASKAWNISSLQAININNLASFKNCILTL